MNLTKVNKILTILIWILGGMAIIGWLIILINWIINPNMVDGVHIGYEYV